MKYAPLIPVGVINEDTGERLPDLELPVNATITLRADDMQKFRDGHTKCGLFDKPEGLIQLAAEIGLAYLERINFDVGATLREDVRLRIGGAQ